MTRTSEKASTSSGTAATGAIFAVVVVAIGAFQFSRRNKGSVDRLVSRGMLDVDREKEDPYYKNAMRGVNKVMIEELTEEQISAARKRRAGDRRKANRDKLENFDIPSNHPWAEKKPVSSNDEELIKQRLDVKKGLPLQELQSRQGSQGAEQKDGEDG